MKRKKRLKKEKPRSQGCGRNWRWPNRTSPQDRQAAVTLPCETGGPSIRFEDKERGLSAIVKSAIAAGVRVRSLQKPEWDEREHMTGRQNGYYSHIKSQGRVERSPTPPECALVGTTSGTEVEQLNDKLGCYLYKAHRHETQDTGKIAGADSGSQASPGDDRG
jgi:hypothetical protein